MPDNFKIMSRYQHLKKAVNRRAILIKGGWLSIVLWGIFSSTVLSQHSFDTWTTDNGLPQNSVSSILQTRDGYLWFTTTDGLVRYDGMRFTIFNAGNRKDLHTSRFSQLLEDREGNLWILTEDTRLVRYTDGIFTSLSTQEGLPDTHGFRIRKDEEGRLIVEALNRSVRWEEGRFVPYDQGLGKAYSGISFPLESGAIWHYDKAKLYRIHKNRLTATIAVDGIGPRDIKYVFEDRKGETWIGTVGVVLRFTNGSLKRYAQKDGVPNQRVNCIRDDRKGNLWIGMSDGGLLRFKDDVFTRYTQADGITGNSFLALYEDREGILWIGTESGLNRLRDNIITSYSTEDGLAAKNTYPICQDSEGSIWIGSWRGLTRYRDGVFTNWGKQYGVANHLITALLVDKEGCFWVGTLGDGVKKYEAGKVTDYHPETGFPSGLVRAICQDHKGSIWFGSPIGLIRYREGHCQTFTTKDGLPSNIVNTIVEDRQNNLWVGTQEGLCRYREGQFTSYAQVEGLSTHTVRTVYEDDEGVIWIGTYDGGLIRLKDGKFTGYTNENGLFNNGVFQILEDARGNFWMSCNLGIYRVSKAELNDYAEGRIASITSIPYGKRDGMLNSECNGGVQPAGIKARDGKLWFPTQGGVAVVDPEAVPVSAQPPPVMVEEVLLNNQPVTFTDAVEVPPGKENFEIHYTGLSFIMSERIRFKYKIEGL